MKHRPERELRNAILALLRAHGIAAWPTGVGAFPASHNGKPRFVRVGSKGMSDIVGILPRDRAGGVLWREGQFLAIEVKNPGGKVSPEQTAFLDTVNKAGGIGFVARSCEDVAERLGARPMTPSAQERAAHIEAIERWDYQPNGVCVMLTKQEKERLADVIAAAIAQAVQAHLRVHSQGCF